ncbi:MAG: hypothetical protein WC914_02430 [Proteiniphilum sp.]
MFTQNYPEKKKYTKYDNDRYLLYLNEELVTRENEEGDEESGFSYTGNFEDGGTIINATEPTYDQFVSGLIRTRYSADQVEAIILNHQSGDIDRADEFQQELDELNSFRQECKDAIASLLEIE